MSLPGRGLRVDVTLEKLDDRVPKVQDGSGDAFANLSGKRTETMNCLGRSPGTDRGEGVFPRPMRRDRGACSPVHFLSQRREKTLCWNP